MVNMKITTITLERETIHILLVKGEHTSKLASLRILANIVFLTMEPSVAVFVIAFTHLMLSNIGQIYPEPRQPFSYN